MGMCLKLCINLFLSHVLASRSIVSHCSDDGCYYRGVGICVFREGKRCCADISLMLCASESFRMCALDCT